jgi:hypothetical protein
VGYVNSDDNDVRQMTIVDCDFFLRGAKRQLEDMLEMTFGNETIFSPPCVSTLGSRMRTVSPAMRSNDRTLDERRRGVGDLGYRPGRTWTAA